MTRDEFSNAIAKGGRRIAAALIAASGLLALASAPSFAAVVNTVTPPACEVTLAGHAYGELAEALQAARSGETLTVQGTCDGTSTVEKNVTIAGGAHTPTLDGQKAGPVLSIAPGRTVRVTGLQIVEGEGGEAGGILNKGVLTLEGDSLTGDEGGSGAGISNSGGTLRLVRCTVSRDRASGNGGALWSLRGSVTITDSHFEEDTASQGAAIYDEGGTLGIGSSTFTHDSASAGGGALDLAYGTSTVSASSFEGDSADYAGAVFAYNEKLSFATSRLREDKASFIGAIESDEGSLTLIHSSLIDDEAGEAGALYTEGALTLTDSTVSYDEAQEYSAMYLGFETTASITGSTISHDIDSRGGAATYVYFGNVKVEDSTLEEDGSESGDGAIGSDYGSLSLTATRLVKDRAGAASGGAITSEHGSLVLTGDTLMDDSAATEGGALDLDAEDADIRHTQITAAKARDGGAIYARDSRLELEDSGLEHDEAQADGGGLEEAEGSTTAGASTFSGDYALDGGAMYTAGTVLLVRSILTKNTAGARGGAVFLEAGALADTGSAMSSNHALEGGAIFSEAGSLSSTSAIFSENLPQNCLPETLECA